VFFNLPKHNTLNTRIANHIKVPYTSDILDIFNTRIMAYEGTDFYPYKWTYNTIYCAKSFDNITYFNFAKNLITYERRTGGEVAIFLPDFLNISYKPVKFRKLNITNKSEKNLLVKTAKDKLYFVSLEIKWHDNKRYIAVLDVKSGKPLFMASKDDEIKSDLLYVVNKSVIPILQMKKQSIFIYLLNLSSDMVGAISWNLMNIKQLIVNILSLGKVPGSDKVPIDQKNEIMADQIKYFYTDRDFYRVDVKYDVKQEDGTGIGRSLYVKSLTIHFKLVLYGENFSYSLEHLAIKIEVDHDNIVCYWDITDAVLKVHKKVHHYREVSYEYYLQVQDIELATPYKMLQRSYRLQSNMAYKYVSTNLYENNCYHIQQSNIGIIVKEKTTSQYEKHYKSSFYRYGKYLIIIQDHIYAKMIFVNTEKDVIYKFVIYSDQFICPRYRYTYHYYPLYKANKLFFLSKDLECLMVVDMYKVEYFINSVGAKNCKALYSIDMKEKYPSIEDISTVWDVKEMIAKAAYDKYKSEVDLDSIVILGHQFDRSVETLYIIAEYAIKNVTQISIFIAKMSDNLLKFEIFRSVAMHSQNSIVKMTNRKSKDFNFVANLDIYGISFDRGNIGNLDIYYNDTGAFVGKHNRISFPVMKGHYDKEKLVVESIERIVIMKYNCKYEYMASIKEMGREYAETDCSSSYGLLLCDLVLVKKMLEILI
jgi:hypothetical protein